MTKRQKKIETIIEMNSKHNLKRRLVYQNCNKRQKEEYQMKKTKDQTDDETL